MTRRKHPLKLFRTLALSLTATTLLNAETQPTKQPPVQTESERAALQYDPNDPDQYFAPYGDYEFPPIPEVKRVSIRKGDVKLYIGGVAKFDGWYAKNPIMLNDQVPDGYEYYKQTFDLILDVMYGKRAYGYPALILHTDIRHKGTWGNVGKAVESSKEVVKLDNAVISSHKHISTSPLLWVKSLWLQISLNALANKNVKNRPEHYLKLGFHPFKLGRGIALGTIYGSSKEFLGIYTGYQNDVEAPGILLHGEIIKKILSYDMYYAKLEERADSLSATFNLDKAHLVGRAKNPFRGVGKDNDLFAFRLKVKPFNQENLDLEIEPYVFYNEASDRKIEMDLDAKSELGTVGLATEFRAGAFEIGGEIAANFGQERLKAIDRNVIKITRADDGSLFEQFSHVLDVDGKKARATTDNIARVQKNRLSGLAADLGPLTNATDRFRPAFTVRYGGWMSVIDASYNIKSVGLQPAATFGYASGDASPFTDEKDKTYKGWIGLQEGYAGKRVYSAFVLDARKLKRPLTLSEKDPEAGNDESFTDLVYTGIGLKWAPRKKNPDLATIHPNILFFWKADRSKKFDATTGKATSEDASSFMGTELNLLAQYEIYSNLEFFLNFAFFVPGTFYRDIQGTPLSEDVFNKLNLPNDSGVTPDNFRLGTNKAWILNLGLIYKF